ncbi:helix-turn-helix domain-containing protein [Ruegeria sp. Ofav3-42]|uniref:helix-turn-helix domain-containing protein n=1 Tax=Ruegeria sp. Ofav3-42 TaxID=2917759 RepID=UPI001EF40B28|nr:helix-turn-helix domain-containing protein [Ruegeria sp. Ofav3-42]MCG7522539.1 helix-turn-helix domain-containing protein [Ruegeria sp. Ofav3-42]
MIEQLMSNMSNESCTPVLPAIGPTQEHLVFLQAPGAATYLAEACIDILRYSNELVGQEKFSWTIASAPETSDRFDDTGDQTRLSLVLLGNLNGPATAFRQQRNWLKSFHGNPRRMLATGSWVLPLIAAEKNRIDRVALHPNFWDVAAEISPSVKLSENSFEFGQGISTAAGFVSTLLLIRRLVIDVIGEAFAPPLDSYFGFKDQPKHDGSVLTKKAILHARGNPLIARAMKRMEENIEFPLPISKFADELGVSPRNLQRTFKKCLGDSPSTIYIRLRLERAYLLLRTTDMPLREIAFACGFGDTSGLSKWFRREVGRPPGQVRNSERWGEVDATTPSV